MNYNPPPIIEDYHQPWKTKLQLIHPCGGGTDENGITWVISGEFYAYPWENIMKLEEKYSLWRPTINEKSMVIKGGGVPIPPGKNVIPNWEELYDHLLTISKIKYIKIENEVFVTREYL